MIYTQHKFRLSQAYFQEHPIAAIAEMERLGQYLQRQILAQTIRNKSAKTQGNIIHLLDSHWDGTAFTTREKTYDTSAITAWRLVMKHFPHIEHFWLAEGDVWRTNDVEGTFFKDRYRIACTQGFEDETLEKRFESASDLLNFASAVFRMTIPSVTALTIVLRQHNQNHPDNEMAIMEMQLSDDPILSTVCVH